MIDAQTDHDDSIGAVVIGRNEGERLRRCLESVRAQVARVVYVDSGSTDGSVELADGLGIETIRLTQGPFTAALGRQTGLDHLLAGSPEMRYVQFIDGDCVLHETWIAEARACLDAHPTVAAVCGRRREEHAQQTLYNALIDIDWDIAPGQVAYIGGDALVRVEAVGAAGGWSTALIAGEEPELCFRMRKQGRTILRLDREATLHDVAMRGFSQYWRRSVRSGHAYAEVGWRHRDSVGRSWLRMTASNLVYGMILPVAGAVGAWWSWLIPVGVALIYIRPLAAMARSCRQRGYRAKLAWTYALCNTVCKVAGAVGVVGYAARRLGGKRSVLIEYNRLPVAEAPGDLLGAPPAQKGTT